jgi:hypothetical protein
MTAVVMVTATERRENVSVTKVMLCLTANLRLALGIVPPRSMGNAVMVHVTVNQIGLVKHAKSVLALKIAVAMESVLKMVYVIVKLVSAVLTVPSGLLSKDRDLSLMTTRLSVLKAGLATLASFQI